MTSFAHTYFYFWNTSDASYFLAHAICNHVNERECPVLYSLISMEGCGQASLVADWNSPLYPAGRLKGNTKRVLCPSKLIVIAPDLGKSCKTTYKIKMLTVFLVNFLL